jgi:addiction module HigA family antidote
MIPKNRIPTHPGQVLLEEFLAPTNISKTRLAAQLKLSVQRISKLVNGKRGVTPEMAWRLAAAFQTSPELWMSLQTQHDLAKSRPAKTLETSRSVSKLSLRGRRGGVVVSVVGTT